MIIQLILKKIIITDNTMSCCSYKKQTNASKSSFEIGDNSTPVGILMPRDAMMCALFVNWGLKKKNRKKTIYSVQVKGPL